MKANPRFEGQSLEFWANVKWLSQHIGYTSKASVKAITADEIIHAFQEKGYAIDGLIQGGSPTELLVELEAYFSYRADVINDYVQSRLMDVDEAKALFQELFDEYNPTCPIPKNKQKGEMSGVAYFTGIINTLIQSRLGDDPCNFDPKHLTMFTSDGLPVRMLSRRVDGAYPDVTNPIAIWEIKEYYYTTTFGSRIADGVYETLLDGMELVEVRQVINPNVKHYLFIDSKRTWWGMGKSYLCRIVDLLNMGYVTEAIFGKEVLERVDDIVKSWKAQ